MKVKGLEDKIYILAFDTIGIATAITGNRGGAPATENQLYRAIYHLSLSPDAIRTRSINAKTTTLRDEEVARLRKDLVQSQNPKLHPAPSTPETPETPEKEDTVLTSFIWEI